MRAMRRPPPPPSPPPTPAAAAAEPIVIRLAAPADMPALGRLGALLVRTHHHFDRRRFMAPAADIEEGYAWFLGTQLEESDVVIYVAERPGASGQPGQVVGYAYAGIEPMSWKELRDPAGFVHDVVVDPDCQGSGIGSRLLAAAVRWLEEHGAPRIMLWTAEKNPGAQRLFARLGFRRTMIEMTRERSS
jgi:ribosomal protein S18 acetylase RimI-like enzyme